MVHTSAGAEARREARRRGILDEARRVVHEAGLEGLKLAPLAKRLGYAVGALYRYFPSKEALLVALEVEILEELGQHLECAAHAAREGADAPDLTAALARVRRYVGFARAAPADFALLGFAIGDPRVLVPDPEAEAVFEAARPMFAAVAEDLERAAEAGHLEPGDPVERAFVLWSALQGVLQTRKLLRMVPQLAPDPMSESLSQSLLRGWGARAADLERANAHLLTLPEETWSHP